MMKIRKLHIKGFKSVANLTLENVSPFLVLAGANGSGKSNITDALAFLGEVVKQGAAPARTRFGGFAQIHCFKYRKAQRTTMQFALELELDGVVYDYHLTLRTLDAAPQIDETLRVDGQKIIDRPANGELHVQLSSASAMQVLPDYPKDITALMLLGSLPLYDFLTNIKVFRIDPLAAKEPSRATTDASELDEHGSNVASVLSRLEAEPEFREAVLEWLALIVPGMESISTETQRLDSSTVITFKEAGTKTRFPAKLVSDGTLYVLCMLTAVLSRASAVASPSSKNPSEAFTPRPLANWCC